MCHHRISAYASTSAENSASTHAIMFSITKYGFRADCTCTPHARPRRRTATRNGQRERTQACAVWVRAGDRTSAYKAPQNKTKGVHISAMLGGRAKVQRWLRSRIRSDSGKGGYTRARGWRLERTVGTQTSMSGQQRSPPCSAVAAADGHRRAIKGLSSAAPAGRNAQA